MPIKTHIMAEKVTGNILKVESTEFANRLMVSVREREKVRMTPSSLAWELVKRHCHFWDEKDTEAFGKRDGIIQSSRWVVADHSARMICRAGWIRNKIYQTPTHSPFSLDKGLLQKQMGDMRNSERSEERWECWQERRSQIEGRMIGPKGGADIWGLEETRKDLEHMLNNSNTESVKNKLGEKQEWETTAKIR